MRVIPLAGLALVGSLAGASASTLQLDFTGQDTGSRNVYFTFDGSNGAGGAGELSLDVVGTGESILAWCVDVAHALIPTSTPYVTDQGLFDADVVAGLERLFTQHYDEAVDAVSSAAFQVAIWELVNDSADIDLDGGRFALRGATNDAVAAKAAEFLSLDGTTGGYALTFLRSTAAPVKGQDLVMATPVPLPASLGFLLAGMVALGAGARRRG